MSAALSSPDAETAPNFDYPAGERIDSPGDRDVTQRAVQELIQHASAGPISDAFIASVGSMDLINGPIGSAKTTSCCRRAPISARGMPPMRDGVRRYTLGVVRMTYTELWGTTIKSWKKLYDWEAGVGRFVGTRGRDADHIITFDDGYGLVELRAEFRSFGEYAEADDFKGFEFTDVWLNEWTTLPETYMENLIGRVGRAPLPEHLLGRPGRIFGDCNAPDVLNYVYRDFFDLATRKPGYQLFRQPGGREAGAENPAMGRAYYDRAAMLNAHRPWWVRAMVDNKPGFIAEGDLIYPEYDDDAHCSLTPLPVYKHIPIVVGIDGGLTPAAVYQQELPDGRVHDLAEVTIKRGGPEELGEAMLAYEAKRFRDCEFFDVIDPSADAGADTKAGSVHMRLAKKLGRKVTLAPTNEPQSRWAAVRAPLKRKDGYRLDGTACPGLRRGFSQTYAFRKIRGSNERSSAAKGFDSHVHDAKQYAALELGESHARKRSTDLKRDREKRRGEARTQQRYNPLARQRA